MRKLDRQIPPVLQAIHDLSNVDASGFRINVEQVRALGKSWRPLEEPPKLDRMSGDLWWTWDKATQWYPGATPGQHSWWWYAKYYKASNILFVHAHNADNPDRPERYWQSQRNI